MRCRLWSVGSKNAKPQRHKKSKKLEEWKRVAKADRMTKGKIIFVKTHSRIGVRRKEVVDREKGTAKKVGQEVHL